MVTLACIKESVLAGDYDRALTALAELALPEEQLFWGYWYQGLCCLLQGDEETAQGIWFSTLMELPEEMAESATVDLCELLNEVATERVLPQNAQHIQNPQEAWLIRQYLAEINPDYFNNRFALLELDDRLGLLDHLEQRGQDILQTLSEQGIFNATPLSIAYSLVIFQAHEGLRTLLEGQTYLDFLLNFVEAYPEEKETLKKAFSEFITRRLSDNDRCLEIAEILESWSEGDFPRLSLLIPFYQSVNCYEKAIVTSEHFLAAADRLEDKIAGYYVLLQSLIKSGAYFDRFKTEHQTYLQLILTLLEQPEITDTNTIHNLIILLTFLSYLQDTPLENNHLKSKVAQRFTKLIQDTFSERLAALSETEMSLSLASTDQASTDQEFINQASTDQEFIDQASTDQEFIDQESTDQESTAPETPENVINVIRIGYISECLRRHSIGYLVRDLFQHHDRSKFEIIAYTFQYTKDNIQTELINSGHTLKIIENKDPIFIYNLIRSDQIDILVDLDSLTSKQICRILALKPAPIQMTWLGYDAPELPTIDYFLVDSYVVPNQAQDYYQEKLWHFPHTYVAVNGFEVGVSPLRREALEIPPKAIVYFSAQTGYKRNPDNIRQQLKILKAIPESYFLIKGYYCDLEALKTFFETLVKEVGVDYDRLRFLGTFPDEETHRATLGLADIVLDTYPYNGATTTLEALWMGIPIVTRVGQQFSARTSYSALMNLGISAGIAWTDEEYVDWGIRLGQDHPLRQRVSLAIQRKQQTAPLWQPQAFTATLETAYQAMQRMASQGEHPPAHNGRLSPDSLSRH